MGLRGLEGGRDGIECYRFEQLCIRSLDCRLSNRIGMQTKIHKKANTASNDVIFEARVESFRLFFSRLELYSFDVSTSALFRAVFGFTLRSKLVK